MDIIANLFADSAGHGNVLTTTERLVASVVDVLGGVGLAHFERADGKLS
jgi:hypothetical protein